MKQFCILDTCSLINLSGLKLAKRSLHNWLWEEFEIQYSQEVLNEINRHRQKIKDNDPQGNDSRRLWDKYVWEYSAISSCERALFVPPLCRTVPNRKCNKCKQIIWKEELLNPNLMEREDRGERHNCCVALDAITKGRYSQIIFLTDDFRAIRDYIQPVFDIFPLGQIWTSLDFVLYIFLRHRDRINLDEFKAVLWDVNGRCPGNAEHIVQRLTNYYKRMERISNVLTKI